MRTNRNKVVNKREYLPPLVEILVIEMEGNIAAGSGAVTAPNSDNQVQKEWEVDPSRNTTIEW